MNALAAQGADINYAWAERGGATPFMLAAFRAQFAMIDALIVAGVRVNAVSTAGDSSLCFACEFGPAKEQRDRARQAGMSCESMSLRLVNTLIAGGANVNNVDSSLGISPLTLACGIDHPSVVDALIKAGANVNYAGHDGVTSLFKASLNGFVETVRVLLAAGADPRISGPRSLTALSAAKLFNHTAVVALLKDRLLEVSSSSLALLSSDV